VHAPEGIDRPPTVRSTQGDRSGAPAWQLGLDGHEAEQRSGNGAVGVTMPEAPASGAVFEGAWRRVLSEAHRVSYLLQIPPPQFSLLFKVWMCRLSDAIMSRNEHADLLSHRLG
jgi:hypothetical protein